MGNSMSADPKRIGALGGTINRNYGAICNTYTRDLRSIRSEMERVISKYSEYYYVTNTARSILARLGTIEADVRNIEKSSQKIVNGLKDTATLYNKAEREMSKIVGNKVIQNQRELKTKKEIADAQVNRVQVIPQNVQQGIEVIGEIITDAFQVIKSTVEAVYKKIEEVVIEMKEDLLYICETIGEAIKDLYDRFIEAFNAFKNKVKKSWESICNKAIELGNKGKELIENSINQLLALVDKFEQKVQEAIITAIDKVQEVLNHLAVKFSGEYKLHIPFGPTITFSLETYTGSESITVSSDEVGIETAVGGVISIDEDGIGEIGVMDPDTETATLIQPDGMITYNMPRVEGDYHGVQGKICIDTQNSKIGAGISLDSRGKKYEEGIWSKLGIDVEFSNQPNFIPVPVIISAEVEAQIESNSNKFKDWVTGGLVEAKDWMVDGVQNLWEGTKQVCSNIRDWTVEHHDVIVTAVTVVAFIVVLGTTGIPIPI